MPTKPKLTTKQQLKKEVAELREQLGILRKQFQQVNLKLAQDLKLFEVRTITSWEYLWSLVEALRVDGKLEFLTDGNLEEFRKVVIERWRAEALNERKTKLQPGQAVCTKCHHVAGGPDFFEGDSTTSNCPNCKESDTAHLKSTVEKEAVAS